MIVLLAVFFIQTCLSISAFDYQVTNKRTFGFATSQEGRHHHHHHHKRSPVTKKSDRHGYCKMINVDSDGKLTLYWNDPYTEGLDTILDVRLQYDGLSWIGVAFTGADGKLNDSIAILGIPNVYVYKYRIEGDEWNYANRMHDKSQTLKDATVHEEKKSIALSFKKCMAEENEIPIQANGDNTLLFAVGESNTFYTPKETFVVNINFPGKESTLAPSDHCTPKPSTAILPQTGRINDASYNNDQMILKNNKRQRTFNIVAVIWVALMAVVIFCQIVCQEVDKWRRIKRNDHVHVSKYEDDSYIG